jgi:ATP-dependent DNA ligase
MARDESHQDGVVNSLPHCGISVVLTVSGYRAMLRSDGRSVRLFTRRNYDWTERFPAIVGTARALRARSFLIDGEAVCCDETGTPVFAMLRQRRNEARVFLYAFDLLQLDRRDMRREPIEVRKLEMAKLIYQRPARWPSAARFLLRHVDQSSSASGRTAGASGFLVLSR